VSGNIMDRVFEVAYATLPRAPRGDVLAHPFGFTEHEPHRWRVSPDVWRALIWHVGFGDPDRTTPHDRLLGEPIRIDDSLPPDSLLLEPLCP
jgi:hypothetical protein